MMKKMLMRSVSNGHNVRVGHLIPYPSQPLVWMSIVGLLLAVGVVHGQSERSPDPGQAGAMAKKYYTEHLAPGTDGSHGGNEIDALRGTFLPGPGPGLNFAASVSTAGDVNGDGYADVIVGANNYSSNTGRAYSGT